MNQIENPDVTILLAQVIPSGKLPNYSYIPELNLELSKSAIRMTGKELHGKLEVEVFVANAIGRSFYAKHGFEMIEEKVHDQTGNDLQRLRLAAS